MRAALKWSAFVLTTLTFAVPEYALAQAFSGDFSLSSGAVYQTAGTDEARAVAVDTISAGGPFIYVTGDSNNAGATVKLSSAGVALASAAFISGGTGVGRGIAVDPSGNVWVAGYSVTGGPVTNWVVQRYNPNLVVLSSTVINGVSLGDAVATSIAFDGSGDAFVAGYSSAAGTGTDFRVMKYSPSLAVLATATFAGAGAELAMALTLDASGNVIVAGYGTPNNYLTVKYNPSLVLLSSVVYDAAGAVDRAWSVTTDPSGNVYVTGESDSGGANFGFTTVKYSPGLAQLAVASYNTPSYDAGFAAVFVGTATLLVAGGSYPAADEDMLILEYNASLALISSRTYDSGTNDRVYAVAKGTGSYIYVSGYSYTSPFGAYRTLRLASSATVNPAFPGCAATNNVGAGQAYATIQTAVNALPASLTGPACVVIKDGATYAEQVTVRGIVNNGWTVSIKPDPATGLTPAVAPPAGSTAAFLIANASVSVTGFDVVPATPIPYGVFISSPYVAISSMVVQDAGGLIATAGLAVSSWTNVSRTSVTVGAATATGIWLPGSVGAGVSYATIRSSATTRYGLWFDAASSNTVAASYITNPVGTGANFDGDSRYNTISLSTITSNVSAYHGLLLNNASYNTVSQSFIGNPSGDAAWVSNSSFNTFSRSTMSAGGAGRSAMFAQFAASNTITRCLLTSIYDTLSLSTGADYNAVSLSTLANTGSGSHALYISSASYNTVTQSLISTPAGPGVGLNLHADFNTISQSTITSGGAFEAVKLFQSSTNTFSADYIQGSTAVYVMASSGNVISGSALVATSPAGSAIRMVEASANLTVTSTSWSAPAGGNGFYLDAGGVGSGVLTFTGNTVTGARYGLLIDTQAAGTSLAVSSLNFTGLASGATAIEFLGGTFVATIAAASFDSSVAVNVDASRLSAASRLTMTSHTGARTGVAYEDDPAGLVDWQDAGAYPGCADTRNVGASQPYAAISAAVAALPASLAGPSCVVIRDGATYAEQVTVRGFANNGSSITIMADPGSGVRPKVVPPAASTAAFVIANASVNVQGVDVVPAAALTYGVLISSPNVALSGVNVQDAGGKIGWAGVSASSWTAISGTSITVGGPIASALWLKGGRLSTVTGSTAAANSATGLGLWLVGASSNAFTSFLASNAGGDAAKLEAASDWNSFSASTFSTTAAAYAALRLDGSSSNTLSGIVAAGPNGAGAVVQNGSDRNTIDRSRFTAGGPGSYALGLSSAAFNTVARSFINSAGGYGLIVSSQSHDNSVSLSTMTSGSASESAMAFFQASSGNFTGNYFQGATAVVIDGSTGAVIANGVLVATNTAGAALSLQNASSGLTLTGSSLRAPPTGTGLSLAADNAGAVALATVTVSGARCGLLVSTQAAGFSLTASSLTFAGLAGGATAVCFMGGTFVTTFSAASFDPSVAVNVDAAALGPASRVTMSAWSGARAGAAYENDPGGLVDWTQVIAPPGFAGAALSASAILWTWIDASGDEDGYRVMSGTISVSGNLPAGTTLWLQTGLSTNAVYGPYYAQVFNAGGVANSTAASRATLAAAPPAPSASGVALTSATVSWGTNGNPAGTTFELERSTGTGFGALSSGPATSYFDALLTPAATFYYRVRARNAESVATVYSSTLAVVALPAPPVPGADGTPAGTALGISSVVWSWALAPGATSHNLFQASDDAFLASSASGPFTQTALTPNTAYGLRAAGVNIGGMGPLSPPATVYTFAAVPSSAAASGISSTTLTASWGLNGNSAATLSVLQRSTDSLTYATVSSAAATSYADGDLLGCTTYYYRVRNFNGDGRPTAYSTFSAVTGNTIPSPPAGLAATSNAGGTIGLTWGFSPTEGVTGYRLYWDAGTGTVSYAAPLVALGSATASYTTGVLSSSASYTFALRSVHRCGAADATGALAMSGAAAALPAVRAAIKEPDSGRRVDGDRVTILGELVSGTPSEVQRVVFQYKLAASTAWLDVAAANVNHPNPDYDFPYFTHADVTTLAPGSYDLRAVAYDRSGVPDPAPPAVRVVVDPIHPDIRETLTIDGRIKKDQTVTNAVASVVDTAGAGATDPAVRVTIPVGAVNAATATVSVISNPAITTAAPSGQTMVGSAIKIDLSNGQSALNGTATITLTYPDTVRYPSLLQLFYLNEPAGRWSRDFATTVNTSSRTVTGYTPHFSTFALMLGTAFAPNLDSVQVYPVPFKPNGPNANEGRPFSAGDPNSGIIFANLAQGSEIRIYTLTGRLVSKLDNAPITGTMRWDARNQDGREVVSGAYFAVIKAGGGKPVIKKLVIIR